MLSIDDDGELSILNQMPATNAITAITAMTKLDADRIFWLCFFIP